ncbi:MAG TPA: V-type ATP synthase subunit E family protein [Candidatus Methylomirabilis sp.]|nr:V-type ATP synthase subunit E family protein [Candidatus Methylomirabilis sp.]
MNTKAGIDDLEAALLARAKALAEEHLVNARRTCDQIISDANEHLRLREESEILAAKTQADRIYRQRVQAAEIKYQEELDRLRWDLVRGVVERLPRELEKTAADEKSYLPLLRRFLARAVTAIEDPEIVAAVNARDHKRLAKIWEDFVREAGVTQHVVLAPQPIVCTGGVQVRNVDDTIRIDNTFEGRLEQLQEALHQVVMERLFASTANIGAILGG